MNDAWLRTEVELRARQFVRRTGLNAEDAADIAQEVLLLLSAKLAADQLQRGMCLEDFTRELCVWRPN